MQLLQLRLSALAITAAAAVACSDQDRRTDARAAAAEVKTVAAVAGDQLADGWVTTKIQAQYFADRDIKGRYVNVSTRDGVVTLKGRVENTDAHDQALSTARNTDGVTQVVDQLTIGPVSGTTGAERIDSAWLTTKIQARYFMDRDLNGRDIHVAADNGVVTISGRVDSERGRQQAIAIARDTGGVNRVEDHLAVDPSAPASAPVATTGTGNGSPADRATSRVDDARITTAIQAKYFLDDKVKGRRIDVDTRNGVVTLRGSVSSDDERAQALLLARTTEGVQRVEDSLTVVP